MNKALYTVLVAAVSVGITLAFVSGCSEKCPYEGDGRGRDGATMHTGYDETDVNEDNDDNQQSTSGEASTGRRTSGAASGSGGGNGSATQEQPLRKYGDAETGGNVYSQGGVPVNSGKPGTTITDSVRKANSKTKAKVPGSAAGGIKTGSDGTRN